MKSIIQLAVHGSFYSTSKVKMGRGVHRQYREPQNNRSIEVMLLLLLSRVPCRRAQAGAGARVSIFARAMFIICAKAFQIIACLQSGPARPPGLFVCRYLLRARRRWKDADPI